MYAPAIDELVSRDDRCDFGASLVIDEFDRWTLTDAYCQPCGGTWDTVIDAGR